MPSPPPARASVALANAGSASQPHRRVCARTSFLARAHTAPQTHTNARLAMRAPRHKAHTTGGVPPRGLSPFGCFLSLLSPLHSSFTCITNQPTRHHAAAPFACHNKPTNAGACHGASSGLDVAVRVSISPFARPTLPPRLRDRGSVYLSAAVETAVTAAQHRGGGHGTSGGASAEREALRSAAGERSLAPRVAASADGRTAARARRAAARRADAARGAELHRATARREVERAERLRLGGRRRRHVHEHEHLPRRAAAAAAATRRAVAVRRRRW